MPKALYSNTLFMLITSLASLNGSGMTPISKALICASSRSPLR